MKQRFVRAAGWTLIGHVLTQLIKLISNLVLTRLLAPEAYGIMSVGFILIGGLAMFSDFGLNAVAVRSTRGDDPTFLNVGWVVQIVRGLIILVAAMLCAVGLSALDKAGWVSEHSVYANPLVPTLVAVLSIQVLLEALTSTKAWVARRHMQFEALTKIDLLCQAATTIVMVVWANISPSIWVLAGGTLFGALLKTVLSHTALPGPPNRFEWEAESFREIFDFGKWVFVSSSVFFLLASGDRLLLGGMLDPKTMGLYSIAFTWVGIAQTAVMGVVGNAVLPALGEVFREKPGELKKTFYRIRFPLDAICLIASGAMVVAGPTLVNILYDKRYASAGWMLSALALTLVATRLSILDQLLVATGRVKLLSALNTFQLVVLYIMIPAGYLMAGMTGAIVAAGLVGLVNSAVVLTLQSRLGLLDARRELLALPWFVVGLASGWCVRSLHQWLAA